MTTDAALCASTDPHLWHSVNFHERRRAVALCGGCEAIGACARYRDHLLDVGERLFGVWAGVDLGMDDGLTRWAQEVAA